MLCYLEMKDIDKTVEQYKMRKEMADEYREEVRRHTERKTKMQSDVLQLERDKTELDAKLKRCQDQYREAEKIKNDIATTQLKLEELERNRKDLESDISRLLNSDAKEIEREIQKFERTKVGNLINNNITIKSSTFIFNQ